MRAVVCVTPARQIVTPAIRPCFRLRYVLEPAYEYWVKRVDVYVEHTDDIRPRAWGELEMAFMCEHLQLGERHLDPKHIVTMAKRASTMWVASGLGARKICHAGLPCIQPVNVSGGCAYFVLALSVL
jgi:hypothetical protein